MKGLMSKFLVLMMSLSLVFCGGSSTTSSSSGSGSGSGEGSGEGGSGDGSSVSALQIAEQMSLVTAQDTSTNANLNPGVGGLFANIIRAAVPTTGDYISDDDEVQTYVFDESMESLDTINNILCSIRQTRYTAMLNQGNYIALVDEAKCDRRGDRSDESSNQSSGQTQEFSEWIVNSSRASNDAPQIITFWLDEGQSSEGEDGESHGPSSDEIRAELVITEGASDTNPFGLFTMNFTGYTDGEATMTGHLSSSLTDVDYIHLQMVMDESDQFSSTINAVLTPGEDEGVAYVTNTFSFDGGGGPAGPDAEGGEFSETVLVAFNSNRYLTRFIVEDQEFGGCLDRENYRTNVWQYNLYDEEGERVSLNGGFPVRSEEGYHGWASYWGIWLPEHLVTLEDGMTLTDDEDNSYTVQMGQGRLIRRTRSELTLDDLEGDSMQTWDEQEGTVIQVEWNGTALVKTATENCDQNGCQYVALDEPEALDLEPYQWIGLWKQGLGGVDLVVPESGELSGDMSVPYYKEEFVSPSDDIFADGNVQMQCVFECLKPNLSGDDLNSGDAFLANKDDFNEEQEIDPYIYTFDADAFDLLYQGDSTSFPTDGEVDQFAPYAWGIMSGAMVLSDVELVNPWEIWDQEVTYTWETGPNEWNRHTALLDSEGVAVEFDQPMSCLYQHDDEGTFFLDYNGEGELHGIPYERITSDDSDFEHWEAVFTIPNGSEMTCNNGESDALYYSKAMVVEQSMIKLNEGECSALNVDAVQDTLGEATVEYEDPELGERPTVDGDPAVIGGILQ